MSPFNDVIWHILKLYLPAGTTLSCVYRSDEDQLQIIVKRAKARGYKFAKTPTVSDRASWLGAWQLVNTKTNPVAQPGHSTHRLGIAYDMTGPDLGKIVSAIQQAAAAGAILLAPPRRGFSNPKREGHCVHVEILGGRIDCEPFDFA